MIFHQAEIVGRGVLDDADEFHAGALRVPAGAASAFSIAAAKSSGCTESRPTLAGGEEIGDGLAHVRNLRAAQMRFQIEDHARRRDEEIAGDQHFAEAVEARAFQPHMRRHRCRRRPYDGRHCTSRAGCGIVDAVQEFVRADLVVVVARGQRFFCLRDRAPLRRDAEPLGEAFDQRLLDVGQRRHRRPASSLSVTTRCAAESSARLASFSCGTLSAASMRAGSISTRTVPWKITVLPSMKPPVPLILRPSTSMSLRGRNFAATPSFPSPAATPSQSALRQIAERGEPERRFVEHQFEAELALVHIDRAAAGDAARQPDAVCAAILDPHLARQRLVAADQHRRRELDEAQRVGHPPLLVQFDQGRIEGDVARIARARRCR